jgi:tagatose-6-phosphate ketose/aldose isomerase
VPPSAADLLARLSARAPRFAALTDNSGSPPPGYSHTLREILQQPVTWPDTAARMCRSTALVTQAIADSGLGTRRGGVYLIGSGSSLYAGASARESLVRAFGARVQPTAAGDILTHLDTTLPPDEAALVISVARSGNSPESCGAVDALLDQRPEAHHLVLSCSAKGKLATRYNSEPRVRTVLLDEATCDQSLVMTSSFSNLALACRFPAYLDRLQAFTDLSAALSAAVERLLMDHGGRLSEVGSGGFRSAIFLGSGDRFQSARESALKMLEMTAGQIATFPETFLGLRHGPMSAVHDDGLIVCFVSSDPVVRAYELDVISELDDKQLKARKVIVGDSIPAEFAREDDVIVKCPGLDAIGDMHAPLVDVVVGQLLAFFRCLSLGLKPDTPSPTGAISRVVREFRIY